jgi:hypothetical protein
VIVGVGVAALVVGVVQIWKALPSGARSTVLRRRWHRGAFHASGVLVALAADAVVVWGQDVPRLVAAGLLTLMLVAAVAVRHVPGLFPVAKKAGVWMVPKSVSRARRQVGRTDVSR